MKKFILLGLLAVFQCACTSHRQYDPPVLTGLQSRVIHSKYIGEQFNANYKQVWWSVVSTLQLHGFVLRDADIDTGYIYGVWQNAFEKETTNSTLLPSLTFNKSIEVIEVSVTLEDKGERGTLVRISSRGDSDGESMNNATFSSRFFASVNKELLLKTDY